MTQASALAPCQERILAASLVDFTVSRDIDSNKSLDNRFCNLPLAGKYSDGSFAGMRLFNVAPVADPEDPFRSKSKITLKLGKRLGSASIASTHEAKKAQTAIDLTDVRPKSISQTGRVACCHAKSLGWC